MIKSVISCNKIVIMGIVVEERLGIGYNDNQSEI